MAYAQKVPLSAALLNTERTCIRLGCKIPKCICICAIKNCICICILHVFVRIVYMVFWMTFYMICICWLICICICQNLRICPNLCICQNLCISICHNSHVHFVVPVCEYRILENSIRTEKLRDDGRASEVQKTRPRMCVCVKKYA